MRRLVQFLFAYLLLTSFAQAFDDGQRLNDPPPRMVRVLIRRAILLAERDRPGAALATIKKALALSPNYLRAHLEYRNIKANYLERLDEVNAEYHTLMRKHPENPVYRMAVYRDNWGEGARPHFEKIIELAPLWAWSHYARAKLLKEKEPEKAVTELRICLAKDASIQEAYELMIEIQERQLKRLDEALRTAEQMAVQREIRPQFRFPNLWRLRLAAAQGSEEAKEGLRKEFRRLADSTTDPDTLLAVRSAYLDQLKDGLAAKDLENKIVRIDPTWNRWCGWLFMTVKSNQSEVPRYLVLANHQIALHEKILEIRSRYVGKDRIGPLEALLVQKPSASVKRLIGEELFRAALAANDTNTLMRYGEWLHRTNPNDPLLLAQMAAALADKKKELRKALVYVHRAERLTKRFQITKRTPNTHQSLFDNLFPESRQRELYPQHRAFVLEALGWVRLQLGEAQLAEQTLQQANELRRTETGLRRWSEALRAIGSAAEADTIAAESRALFAHSIRRKMVNIRSEDFELESIDGRKVKLSGLKGKVVLLTFWATWCVPCRSEMPHLMKLYEKYRDQGFELLSISTDDDMEKVRPFVDQQNLRFAVFNETRMRDRFGVELIPTNIFFDKEGNLRYRTVGYSEGGERELEVVINELLK
jgi:thiol-disulfide isomerase/thioredoxin